MPMPALAALLDADGVIAHCHPLIKSRGSLEHRRRHDPTFPPPLDIPAARKRWWSRPEIDRWLQDYLDRTSA